jgi:hypothetical protein
LAKYIILLILEPNYLEKTNLRKFLNLMHMSNN